MYCIGLLDSVKLTTIHTLWSELKKAALLGLARHPLSTDVLRELDALGVNVGQDPADVLLEAAAVVSRMQRAALPLEKHPTDLPAPADLEDAEALEPGVVRLLQPVFEGDYQAALPEVLDLMRKQGKQLPGEMLPALFERLGNKPTQLERLRPLWGDRGEWWLCQHPRYRLYARVPPPESWTTGDAAARVRFLQYLRRFSPDEGRALLAASWDKLPKEEKPALLRALQTTPTTADLPFLESLQSERAVAIRRMAMRARLQAGDTVLRERLTARFEAALTATGSPDGPVVRYTPPAAPDAQAYADGLSARQKPSARWEQDYLEALLSGVPVAQWSVLLPLDDPELLGALLRSDQRDALVPAYIAGLVAAADTERLVALWERALRTADATLLEYADQIAATATRLPATVVDQLLLEYAGRQDQLIRDNFFWKLLFSNPHPWSNNLTLALLKPFQRYLRNDQLRGRQLPAYRQLLKVGAYRIDPALKPSIEASWYTFGFAYGQWEQAIEDFHQILDLRGRIRKTLQD